MIIDSDIKEFLDEKLRYYNVEAFIESDPIQVPHRFSAAEDIEIAAFLTASIAWGKRSTIIQNANALMDMMPGGPYHFLMKGNDEDFSKFLPFVHRTFNGHDCIYFLRSLQKIYHEYNGLGAVFSESYKKHSDIYHVLADFRALFFSFHEAGRTSKHVSDVTTGSAAKRLNMFLRWMVRKDNCGVDFGIWNSIPMSALYVPLDVHSGSTARKLGLLQRKQNDWKAVEELTSNMAELDPADPVKYDYALFGLGVFEKF